MPTGLRAWFPYFLATLIIASVVWASSFGTLPPADFTFVNSTEVESVDPHTVTGQPESRVIYPLFEGLYNFHPKTLDPVPGVAESVDISTDLKTYTFHLRKNAKWSDGSPLTAEDFRWSWWRMLHPETAAKYGSQAYPIRNAERFNTSQLVAGDPVEVELGPRERPGQLLPRGKTLEGKLQLVERFPPGSNIPRGADEPTGDNDRTVYTVEIAGQPRKFSKAKSPDIEGCLHVTLDFKEVGVKVIDPYTLQVDLAAPTPYFLKLVAFYTLFPIQRACFEKHGVPAWTHPENLVCNGAFTLEFRRIRDRIRLKKNPLYWDAEHVALNTVDALAVQSELTALNLYLAGQVDWIPSVPSSVIPELLERSDFEPEPELTVYFYRLNTKRPELRDPRVRRALAMAIDKQAIVEGVVKAGDVVANTMVPPGIAGYAPAKGLEYDPVAARKLLAEAGYPNGEGLPEIEILFNTMDLHREIAEVIQSQWQANLGIKVRTANQEWASYLTRQATLDYDVCRAGWVGDYVDPNTFLELFITDRPNNQTGWSNKAYDGLMAKANSEVDPVKRFALLHDAEQILVEEVPIIPIYFRVDKNMVSPRVQGFYRNLLDNHPLSTISVLPKDEAPPVTSTDKEAK